MADRVINDQTGEILELQDGEWVSVKGPKPMELLQSESPGGRAIEAAMVSAGDQFATLGRNARDVWARVRGDDKTRSDIAAERQEADRIRANFRGESPIASTVGAMLPTAPLMLLGGPAAAPGVMGALRVAGTQAALGGLQSAAFSEEGDFGKDALIGGAMSGGMTIASQIAGRVMAGRAAIAEARAAGGANQAVNHLTEGEADIIAGARRAGMQVTPAQATGNDTYRKLEAGLSGNPLTSGHFDQVKMANDTQLNRLAARAIGMEADNVGAAVRTEAERAISSQFDDVGKQLGHVDIGPMIKDVEQMALDEGVKGMPRTQIDSIVRKLKLGERQRMAAAKGEAGYNLIPGEDMMEMRSTMSRNMRDAFNQGKSELGELYGEVLEKYDDAIGRAASAAFPDDPKKAAAVLANYQDARDKWSIWKAIDRNGASEEGNILPGRIAQNLKASDRSRYWGRADKAGNSLAERGTGNVGENPMGDFYDALRFSNSQIGRPIVPNTGGTVGAFQNWLNSGGTASSLTKAAAARLGGGPLMRSYMDMSPAATQAMMATQAFMRGQPMGGGMYGLAQGVGRTGLAGFGGAFE